MQLSGDSARVCISPLPTTDSEITQMEMMNGVIGDWRMGFGRLCYMPEGDDSMDTYVNIDDGIMGRNLPVWRKKMNNFLKQNDYCAGGTLTESFITK